MFHRLHLLCLLPLACAIGLGAQPVPSTAAAMIPIAETFVASHDGSGIAMALVEGLHTTWSGAFGLADRAAHKPVSASTIFELGSISKVFTCIAVMQLVEAGKVDLDRPYVAYVPEFTVKSRFQTGGEAITVRMLMTHHSGLIADDDPWEIAHPARRYHQAVLEHVKDTELLYQPGELWSYSSFGTSLLGVLIERVSGMEFTKYLRKKVLAPMGMPDASFDLRDLPEGRIATAYNYNPGYDQTPKDGIRPGGSLRAPIPEAARLLSLVLNGGSFRGRTILKPESMAEMVRVQNGENPLSRDTPMGLGFRIANRGSLTFLFHDGISRHRSLFVLVPSKRAGVIVAINDHKDASTLVRDVRMAFLSALEAP